MSESEHLFISDVHLGAFQPAKEQELQQSLLSLIKYATECHARIYILGDLFDYWMEYPAHSFIPELGKSILDAFEQYNSEIGPALYVTGNHDNWTFGHFESRGFDLEPNARIIHIEGQRILLMHGDGKFGKRKDLLRPMFHQILRSKTFISAYQHILRPKSGLEIMKRFSSFSKRKEYLNPIPLDQHAEQILREPTIDVVLCGHDHVPRLKEYEGGLYVNLGTFFHHSTMVRYINGKLSLVVWDAVKQEFSDFNKTEHTL